MFPTARWRSRLKSCVLTELPPMQKDRIRLIHGSLMYRDKRLAGYDAATVVEVIEHQDPPRLAAFERVLFEFARPQTVVVTTPNVEYNVKFETLPAGKLRHKDHRFEWTRANFKIGRTRWQSDSAIPCDFLPVGPEDPAVGSPTQMGVFAINEDHDSRTGAGRAHRPVRLRQVELRPEAFQADRSALVGLLPRPGLRRREQPSGDERRVRGPALHRVQTAAAGKLTVIDATNVQPEARKPLIALAREYHCLPVAIVLNCPRRSARNGIATAPDRNFGPHVIRQQSQQLRRSLRGLEREGFRHVHMLSSAEEVDAATIERAAALEQPRSKSTARSTSSATSTDASTSWSSFSHDSAIRSSSSQRRRTFGYSVKPPEGRKACFVGDLVDRGPKISEVLRLVMSMVEAGSAFCVPGNHDIKLLRKLRGTRCADHARPRRFAWSSSKESHREFRKQVAGVHRRSGQPLCAGRRKAGRRARGHEGRDAGPRFAARSAILRFTARRLARRTSSVCRCVTTGRRNTAARRWWFMATRPFRSRNG